MKRFLLLFALFTSPMAMAGECPAHLQQTLKKLHSADSVSLCDALAGKPALVVNTASHCGYTRQFKGLEALHQRWKEKGLVVIGFPSDDFFQESDDQAETATVCYRNYGVTFLMTEPVSVRGTHAIPLFKTLADQSQPPRWNFNKYVIDRQGKVVAHFGSDEEPDSAAIAQAIEKALH